VEIGASLLAQRRSKETSFSQTALRAPLFVRAGVGVGDQKQKTSQHHMQNGYGGYEAAVRMSKLAYMGGL